MKQKKYLKQPDEQLPTNENRYSLVNHVAQRAKQIIEKNVSDLSNNKAISDAIQQVEKGKSSLD